jgi:hypothetical protein
MAGIHLPAGLIMEENMLDTMIVMNNMQTQRREEDKEMAAEEAAYEEEEARLLLAKKKNRAVVFSQAKVYAVARVNAVAVARMWNDNVRGRARTVGEILDDQELLELADEIATLGREDGKPAELPTSEEVDKSYIKAYQAFAKAAVAKITDVNARVPTHPECEELVRKIRAAAKKKIDELHRHIALNQAELARATVRAASLTKQLSRASSMDRFVRRAMHSSEEHSTRANDLAQIERAQQRLTAEIGSLALQITQVATAASIDERDELRRCIERVEARIRRHEQERRAAGELAVASMAALSVQHAVVQNETDVKPADDDDDEDVDDKPPKGKGTTTSSQEEEED